MSPSSSIKIEGFISPVPLVRSLGITIGASFPPLDTDFCTRFINAVYQRYLQYSSSMSRAYSPGGRFTSNFERNAISAAIDVDLTRPAGTSALWYIYDQVNSEIDPIYDVGDNLSRMDASGRLWRGPYTVPVIKAVIGQGNTKVTEAGFYNADTLQLTISSQYIEAIEAGTMMNPDDQNRSRIIWKNEVFRPYLAQQKGIINENFVLLSLSCQQVMPEEMVNDPQFLSYTDNAL